MTTALGCKKHHSLGIKTMKDRVKNMVVKVKK